MIRTLLSPWFSTGFLAVPGEVYDAPLNGKGERMAKFEIQFVYSPSEDRRDETVEADYFDDHGDFVDFTRESNVVARYRASEIRRVLRLEG